MLFAFFSKNFLKYLIVLSIIFSPVYFFGEEGMWIPFEMDTNAMKRFGLEIPFAQLYSIEQESIKDAVVLFGGGCTGEIISSQGLLLTNHHCGYYFVASASDTINNYLKNGFWANSLEQEIPMPGLKVSKIVQYINITNRVYNKTENIISNELKKDSLIANHLKFILDSVQAKSSNQFVVKTTFNASQFYLLELQVFKDVRLVGVPPVNIGNFGGDYDNWLWPRHNADFAVFRIYAGEDNKPATYSKNNKPYVSNTFLKINISGVQENDFSMVYGFPGSTIPYLSSFGLESDVKYSIPMQIKIREKHLNVLKKYMENNEQYMLLYTAHSNKISNYYKKMEGQLIGLKYFDVLSKKKSIENDMLQTFSSEFDVLITNMDKTYAQYNQNILENVFYTEGLQMLSLYKIFRQFDKYKTIGNLNDSSFAKMFSDVYTLLMSNKIISIEKDILHTFLTQYLHSFPTRRNTFLSVIVI